MRVLDFDVSEPACFGLVSRGHSRRGRVEGGFESVLQRAEADDDANADDGSDEAVLDGGCARLIRNETCEKVLHDLSLPNVTLTDPVQC